MPLPGFLLSSIEFRNCHSPRVPDDDLDDLENLSDDLDDLDDDLNDLNDDLDNLDDDHDHLNNDLEDHDDDPNNLDGDPGEVQTPPVQLSPVGAAAYGPVCKGTIFRNIKGFIQ